MASMLSDSDTSTTATSSTESSLSSGFSSQDHIYTRRHTSVPESQGWVCDPTFGIIHRHGCSICRSYKSHCVEASRRPDDPTFQQALKNRDSIASLRYFEGIEEGRCLQAEHDRTRMYRYRHERDEARGRIVRYEEDTRRLRLELLEMQDNVMAMQVAYDEQILELVAERMRYAAAEDDFRDALSHQVDLERGQGKSKEAYSDADLVHLQSAPHPAYPFPPPSSEGQSSDWESGLSSDSSSVVIVPEPAAQSKQLSIKEVQSLIALANDPQHPEALIEVRSLCSKAHHTPRRHRTPAQKFLLDSWRTPVFLRASHHTPSPAKASSSAQPHNTTVPTAIPSLASVPEMIVDASLTGIGFLMKRHWLAWKLRDGWRANGRDMIWAELAAVELGLRTAISLGVRSAHLRVRSDNSGVITALKTKTIRVPHDMEVLNHILALCHTHSIELMPVWIWTKVNPADPISRQCYPPASSKVDGGLEIPPHLAPFVEPIGLVEQK